jgi:hypothetical protein
LLTSTLIRYITFAEMRTSIKLAVLSTVLIGSVACGSKDELPKEQEPVSSTPPPIQVQTPQPPDVDFLAALNNLPPNASREQMDRGVEDLMSAYSNSRSGDSAKFLTALAALRQQPQLVSSIVAYYDKLPQSDHAERIATLAILGEVKRPDALPFLQKIVWTPMPSPEPAPEGFSQRELEEMVIVKALHGVGYLRTPDSDKSLLDVIKRHESHGVKISAIDSYMWNHDDSKETAQALYQMLPADMHKFVERPRYFQGMDRNKFNEQLKAWQQKWGTPNQ